MRSWTYALVLAALGFAAWTGFALFNSSGRLREAWDTGAYWTFGVPLLLVALFAAGAATGPGPGRAPWQFALYAALGHALAAAFVVPGGTDFGLLPLTLALVGLPMFVAFFVAATLGRLLGRLWRWAARRASCVTDRTSLCGPWYGAGMPPDR